MDIKCPACGSEDVNMIDAPIAIENNPCEHGWYGQCHRVKSPMVCESCRVEFAVIVSAYKNRAYVSTEFVE